MDPEERLKSQVNAWFDEDVWIGVEEPIRPDEKGDERTLSFGDRMAYKSYLTGKHQHTESRTKLEVMKNLVKKWATAILDRGLKAHLKKFCKIRPWCSSWRVGEEGDKIQELRK
ncbi:hypothetical protein Tco_0267486 [Tanacetum coccineum]